MEAIILAGGRGTRLQSVVSDVPKPMAPIKGKPFLGYVMHRLGKSGIRRVILSVGYKCQCIMNYFRDEYQGMSIEYAVEEKPLGTGGAIKAALRKCNEGRVFVLNGDTFFDVDYPAMYGFAQDTEAPLVMAVKEMREFDRYGRLDIVEGKIASFHEKKFCKWGFINGGVYCMLCDALDSMRENVFSFEKDFLEKYYDKLAIPVFMSKGYFVDIGIPKDYWKAVDHFK